MTDRHPLSPEAPHNAAGNADAPAAAPPGSSLGGNPKRKAIPVRTLVTVALLQAEICGHPVLCALCRKPLGHAEPRILEHMTPHATLTALGQNPDVLDNLRWVHRECAHRKTFGSKATTAGSDAHMIAKGVRFDKINRGERSRTRKGPPLKSGGFRQHPTLRRTMAGKVVPK